jgi:hypothetical protein
MEILSSICLYISTVIIIYRAWSFYQLKAMLDKSEQKTSIVSFLLTDFGRLDNLFIWYVKETSEDKRIKRQILLVNRLTSSFFVFVIIVLFLYFMKPY